MTFGYDVCLVISREAGEVFDRILNDELGKEYGRYVKWFMMQRLDESAVDPETGDRLYCWRGVDWQKTSGPIGYPGVDFIYRFLGEWRDPKQILFLKTKSDGYNLPNDEEQIGIYHSNPFRLRVVTKRFIEYQK